VLWLNEDLFCFGEFPSLYSAFSLDLHLSFMVLTLPLVKHSNTLVDNINSLIGLLSEYALDVDLAADFVADLI
jgi:hypothetical protein